MICPKCGVENSDDASFCKNCATSLKKDDIEEIKDDSDMVELNSESENNNVNISKGSNQISKHSDVNISKGSNQISKHSDVSISKTSNQISKHSDSGSSNSNPKKNNTLIICLTVIICVAIVVGALIYLNPTILSNSDNNGLNDSSSQVSNTDDTESSDSVNSVAIRYCDFYTGSSSSDKSYCSANIGTEHYGENYQISVLYSSNGSNLNDGNLVGKTVDDEGFLHISSSNAFLYYPDKAIVTVYDMDDNVLDQKTYYLNPVSGSQSYS